ncbi:hypothetical protein O7627_03015 [Solwaraspora sp. WMMD1047]|uniref:hypothetical protein n=1 Tax=Solwaraspora sp. WMMD1047 TaxID=3016102 RepID=UPI00241624BA|nr:hypothetical protein [Solwaraspora sp. WMMD1047]MDG4828275.1 hypothetical protein [Solwaraspora sp. WMMD1047]
MARPGGRGRPVSYGFPPRPSGRGGSPWRRLTATRTTFIEGKPRSGAAADRPVLGGG